MKDTHERPLSTHMFLPYSTDYVKSEKSDTLIEETVTTLAVSQKTEKLCLSELIQICTKFDNFWHTDDRDDRIMSGSLSFDLT